AQNGKAGVSPRGSIDISRINFRGTQQSLTLHTTFGLLEKVATLTFNNPQFLGKPSFTAAVSGGYSNVQNITTFQASTLQGDFRVTQKYKKADTVIYDFLYRRVSVNPNSLEITPNLIPQLSQPVTVGGPSITYFHDTRDPSPVDAGRGEYYSLQEFVSSSKFGAQTDFNRLDMSYSSYYSFGNKKYIFARNTRVGFENTFGSTGSGQTIGVVNCQGNLFFTNATCNPVPLPERMYAGGATSHRGFGINGAGPRDLRSAVPLWSSTVWSCACRRLRFLWSAIAFHSCSFMTWATSSAIPATCSRASSTSASPISKPATTFRRRAHPMKPAHAISITTST